MRTITDGRHKALVQKLPRMYRELVEGNTTLSIYIAGLGGCVYLVSRSARIWPMLISTTVGPLLASLSLVFKPLHPFDNLYARFDSISRRKSVDHDVTARALIELLKSKS